MIVDDASDRGFIGRCQRPYRIRHVVVDQPVERFGPHEERRDQQEELRLTLAEIPNERHHERGVALLLADEDGGGMLARRREVWAVVWTRDLDPSLRAAADRADLLAKSRTGAFRASSSTKRAHHSSNIV